jgi:hypothetical protein
MSSDFSPYLIKDSRINNITDSVSYGVYSGASQNTYQSFQATTKSPSQMSFNVSIPSENTILDRNVLIQATYKITITIPATNTIAKNSIAFQYGLTDAFQAFPINSSITSMNATINNTNVSINSQDVLPQLLRMIDPKQLQKYNGMCPTLPDNVGDVHVNFTDTPLKGAKNCNPLAAVYNSSYDNYILPRGCHPLDSITVVHAPKAGGNDTSLTASDTGGDTWTITLTATFTEPLFLSPFLFGGKHDFNNQGFVGLNTLNLNLNIDSSFKRGFSSALLASAAEIAAGGIANTNATIALTEITEAKLLLNFLTTQPTDLVKVKNIVPFIDYPRYLTTATNAINAAASSTITSQNIQLNQIPDLFIICVRKPMSTQTIRDANSFMQINSVSINFNNASGLLSSASRNDLWRMSRDNGSYQSWYEFYGKINKYNTTADGNVADAARLTALSQITTGSLLVINPSRDLSLPAYLSNGSLGQFNFQIQINVTNNTTAPITPELVVITANSGVFSTTAGSSAVYTGLLTKQMVLDTAQQENGISSSSVSRLTGGSLSDMISTSMKLVPTVSKAIENASGRGGAMSAGAMRKLDNFVM